MSSRPDSYQSPNKGSASELGELRAIAAWSMLELALQSSRTAESSERAGDVELVLTSKAGGQFIGARDIFVGAKEADNLLHDLRHMLALPVDQYTSDDQRERLVELWAIAERCLAEADVSELGPSVLTRLMGGKDVDVVPSRDDQQLGGGC